MASICFLVIITVAMALLHREKLFKSVLEFSICLGVLVALFVLRWLCMAHITLDYTDFLAKWVDFFRRRGGISALKYSIGNYNVPYLYILALISYIPAPDMYLIKIVSVIFDVVLAFGGLKLVSLFTESRIKKLACFLVILFLPTVILNGSCWAQCDSIYAAFALWSLYFALKGRPVLSVALIAVSFGFKMQAVFIMPVFLVFLFAKKLRMWHLFVFPLTYLVLILPAAIAGRPLIEMITLYFNQIDTVGTALNYNSSSVFAFFYRVADMNLAAKLGILASFAFVAAVYAVTFIKRKNLTNETLLTAALLFCVGVPFFLPHMHDRYFYLADVLSVCFAVLNCRRSPVPLLVSFASVLGYHAYLKRRFFLPMHFGAAALVIVLAILIFELVYTLFKKDRQEPLDNLKY